MHFDDKKKKKKNWLVAREEMGLPDKKQSLLT